MNISVLQNKGSLYLYLAADSGTVSDLDWVSAYKNACDKYKNQLSTEATKQFFNTKIKKASENISTIEEQIDANRVVIDNAKSELAKLNHKIF